MGLTSEGKTSRLGKLRGVGEVFGYIVDLIFLWDYFTTKGALSYLSTSIGAQAQAIYNIVVLAALALAFCVPFYFGLKFQSWRTRAKKITQEPKTTEPTRPMARTMVSGQRFERFRISTEKGGYNLEGKDISNCEFVDCDIVIEEGNFTVHPPESFQRCSLIANPTSHAYQTIKLEYAFLNTDIERQLSQFELWSRNTVFLRNIADRLRIDQHFCQLFEKKA